ncbi:MAG: hypothetical protein PHN31_06585 [Candidatus Gracilibacteria bacterium]|nr:hypothetical protein [Candidatus Gracilibacteria bacterium]
MLAVNLGLTNEKSGVSRVINLNEKDLVDFEVNENNSIDSQMQGNYITRDDERESKIRFCKREILLSLDSSFDFLGESNINDIFSHTELLVGNLKPYITYCVNKNKDGVYTFANLKNNVNNDIDKKFINNIISDIYSYDSYNYVRNFFSGSGAKEYFGSVIKSLDDVTEDELKSTIMIEQLRGTMTNRGFFKQMVKNNILQSFTDFSLGIGGMKISTALEIEKYLKDSTSEFYLGKKYETILDDVQYNKNLSLQKKLTENINYYHQYLYTGLAIKMIKKQWMDKGYDLNNKFGIIATIYNLGLNKSKPNGYPKIGGAEIFIDGKKWYFGELGEKIWISLQKYK